MSDEEWSATAQQRPRRTSKKKSYSSSVDIEIDDDGWEIMAASDSDTPRHKKPKRAKPQKRTRGVKKQRRGPYKLKARLPCVPQPPEPEPPSAAPWCTLRAYIVAAAATRRFKVAVVRIADQSTSPGCTARRNSSCEVCAALVECGVGR